MKKTKHIWLIITVIITVFTFFITNFFGVSAIIAYSEDWEEILIGAHTLSMVLGTISIITYIILGIITAFKTIIQIVLTKGSFLINCLTGLILVMDCIIMVVNMFLINAFTYGLSI